MNSKQLLLLCAALLFPGGEPARAATGPHGVSSPLSFPDFDLRPASAAPTEADPIGKTGEARLRERLPKLEMERSPRLDTPRWMHARDGFLTGPAGEARGMAGARGAGRKAANQPRAILKAFVNEHAPVFGHDASLLPDDAIVREFVSHRHGLQTVQWEQRLEGVPLYRCYFKAHVTRQGELVSLADELMPRAAQVVSPLDRQRAAGRLGLQVSARSALLIALESMSIKIDPALIHDPDPSPARDQMHEFTVPGARAPARLRLVWLPWSRDTLRLCWRVWLTRPSVNDGFEFLVEAGNGEVLKRCRLTVEGGSATYRHFQSDSPSPMSPGFFTPGTNQPTVVSRVLSTLSSLSATASPDGWIFDSENSTSGNNARAIYWEQLDETHWVSHQVEGSAYRVFDYPLNLNQDPVSYRKASVVNAFYWVNWAHDKFYGLGFTEAAGNAQEDNFGRGGVGGDALDIYVQDLGLENNASLTPWPEGTWPTMKLGIYDGPAPDRDAALDTEIILHEYTHLVSNRLVGDGSGIRESQSQGMGEGWSDFFALALLSQSGDVLSGTYAKGAYVARQMWGYPFLENYYFGIRRYPYSIDQAKNPLTFNDIDPDQFDVDPGIPTSPMWVGSDPREVHNQGEVWCSMLWDMRANLIAKFGFNTGHTLAMQLVLDGMNLAPTDPSFLQARNAILLAELLDPHDAFDEIWDAFAGRGLGSGAQGPPSTTTLGVVENFDGVDDLLVWPPQGQTIAGPVGGPFDPSTIAYALTNDGSGGFPWRAHADLPFEITPDFGILGAGENQTVTLALNGAAAASLPAGTRTARLYFTNLVSGAVVERAYLLAVGLNHPPAEFFTGGADSFDLYHRQLVFTPDESGLRYDVCTEAEGVASLPVDPAPAETLDIQGQTFAGKTLGNGKTFPFHGNSYRDLAVSDNGCVVLGDHYLHPLANHVGLTAHFAVPRISVMLANFEATSYRISWQELSDRAVVTWERPNVQAWKMQLELFFDGRIRMTFIEIEFGAGVCGLSWGDGPVFGFGEKNLSQAYECDLLKLTLTVPPSVAEGDGVLAGAGLVSVPRASASPRQINLTSSDPTEIRVPASVTIPAFRTSASFDLTVVDDTRRDATQVSFLHATGKGLVPTDAALRVHDNEPVALHLNLPSTIKEGAFFSVGEVSMNGVAHDPVGVPLYSLDTNELYIPPVVFIPEGQTSALFITYAINDARLDGPRNVIALAQVENWTNALDLITVLDDESTEIKILTQTFFNESMGSVTNGGQIVMGGTLTSNLFVPLISDDPSEVTLGLWAIVLEGESNAFFNVNIVDDTEIDGLEFARIRATAAGFTPGTNVVWVGDNDGPPEAMDPHPPDLSTDVSVDTHLSWNEVGGELVVNGDFEDGQMTGWHLENFGGGSWMMNRGTLDPASPDGPMPPLNKNFSALSNPMGNGRHVLWQDVFIPIGATTSELKWTHQIRNHAGVFDSGQQFRVELRDPAQNQVLVTLFTTDAQQPAFGDATNLVFDLKFYRNRALRVAFVEEDSLGYLNVQIDNVSLSVGAASPTTFHVFMDQENSLGPEDWLGTTNRAAWTLPLLAGGQTYYWQVQAVRGGLTNTGPVWRFTTEGSSSDVNLIAFNATWKYQNSGGNLGTTWTNLNDDDSSWSSGRAPLGFGGTQATVIGTAGSTIITYYFRREFNIPDLSRISELSAQLIRDDGAVVYINGQEAIRSNMPRGQVDYRTEADRESSGADETTAFGFELDSSLLVLGTNIAAVEVHQKHPLIGFSDDLAFNFQLTARYNVGNERPLVTLTAPRDAFDYVRHPGNLILRATVEDDETGHAVEFFANGVSIGRDDVPTYAINWTSPDRGLYEIIAVATDPGGLSSTSAPVSVLVASADSSWVSLVSAGSSWRYLDTGITPASDWTDRGFRERSGWKTGAAQLGYGDGDEATIVGFGRDLFNRYLTTWFRQTEVKPAVMESLQLRVLRDDGVVVYLNGQEILRDNLPDGVVRADTRALSAVEGAQESTWRKVSLDPALASTLVQPTGNLVAAEVHQASPSSSDLSFDLELSGTGNFLPLVALSDPAEGASFIRPPEIPLAATASDPYGAVTRVEFFADGAFLGLDTTPPYQWLWISPSSGAHLLWAAAVDNAGATNVSVTTTVFIVTEPRLTLRREEAMLSLHWPGWAEEYAVSFSTNLIVPADWIPLNRLPMLIDDEWVVPLDLNAFPPPRYFRLEAP